MSIAGSNDDCYFYYYSSCTKGDDCPFRHCQAALGTETVCSLWREGLCVRDNCKFRHMESRINRKTIPCYWEDQPSGCLKPHCVFFHRKLRSNVHPNTGKSEGLILPVSTMPPQASPLVKVAEVKDNFKNVPVESYSTNNDDSDTCPASIPIEPIVFSFDNEESDSESASSTPMKSATNDSRSNSVSAKKNLSDILSDKTDDFGVKTLEQIKMEKIHKESDNFYKSAYDAPLIDLSLIKKKPTDSFKAEIYPPKAEFISISVSTRPVAYDAPLIDPPLIKKKATDNFKAEIYPPNIPITATADSKDQSCENERNLRNRLLKRKNVSVYPEKSVPPKKVINLKTTKDNDTLDFKIKTLDEIRKEKMNKLGKEEAPADSTSNVSPKGDGTRESVVLNNKESPNLNRKSFRKLKLKRQSNDIQINSNSIVQEADSSSDNQKKERNQMILHEVQNISEDQNKIDLKAFTGKRKESPPKCTDEKSPKQIKLSNSSSSKNALASGESEEKQVKSSRPVIKRRSTSLLFQQSGPSPKEMSSRVENVPESTVLEKSEKIVKEDNNNIPKEKESDKSLLSDNEKSTPRTSVDDIDSFLLNEANVTLDYEPDGSNNESDDILLEIEQLLDS